MRLFNFFLFLLLASFQFYAADGDRDRDPFLQKSEKKVLSYLKKHSQEDDLLGRLTLNSNYYGESDILTYLIFHPRFSDEYRTKLKKELSKIFKLKRDIRSISFEFEEEKSPGRIFLDFLRLSEKLKKKKKLELLEEIKKKKYPHHIQKIFAAELGLENKIQLEEEYLRKEEKQLVYEAALKKHCKRKKEKRKKDNDVFCSLGEEIPPPCSYPYREIHFVCHHPACHRQLLDDLKANSGDCSLDSSSCSPLREHDLKQLGATVEEMRDILYLQSAVRVKTEKGFYVCPKCEIFVHYAQKKQKPMKAKCNREECGFEGCFLCPKDACQCDPKEYYTSIWRSGAKHCPYCHRGVARIAGCLEMTCGKDTHSSQKNKSGCGKKFNWNAPDDAFTIKDKKGKVIFHPKMVKDE